MSTAQELDDTNSISRNELIRGLERCQGRCAETDELVRQVVDCARVSAEAVNMLLLSAFAMGHRAHGAQRYFEGVEQDLELYARSRLRR